MQLVVFMLAPLAMAGLASCLPRENSKTGASPNMVAGQNQNSSASSQDSSSSSTSCAADQVANAEGVCEPLVQCPAGQQVNQDGACAAAVICYQGRVLNAEGQCVLPDGALPMHNGACSPLDEANGLCTAQSPCPLGQVAAYDGQCTDLGANRCSDDQIYNQFLTCVYPTAGAWVPIYLDSLSNGGGPTDPSSPALASQMSVGEHGVWIVTAGAAGNLKLREGMSAEVPQGSNWRLVEGIMRFIADGSQGVWAVGGDGAVWYRQQSPQGGAWTKIDGTLTRIASGYYGVWGISPSQEVVYRAGLSASTPQGSAWETVPGVNLKDIAVAMQGVWGVGNDHKVYYRRGVSLDNPKGSDWSLILEPDGNSLPMRQVAVANYGVWATDPNDQLYVRIGFAPDRPDGRRWVSAGAKLEYVAAGRFGIWGLKDTEGDDEAYGRNKSVWYHAY